MKKLFAVLLGTGVIGAVLLLPATRVAPQPAARGIENAAGLDSFFRSLSMIGTKRRIEPVRVMHFGDSHTAADILTAEIRRSFQRDFGDGGAGLVSARNPFSTPRRGVQTGTTDGWWIDGLAGKGATDGIYGPAGFSLSTDRADERAWLQTNCNHFEIYYLKQPGGGRLNIYVDGASVVDQPLSLVASAPAPDYFIYDSPL